MSGRRRFGWLLAAVWVLCAAPVFAAEGRTQEAPLVIGTELDYPPYSFLDEDGKPTGYNVELTQAIARVMELDVEVKIGPWAKIRQALETGEIDAISGMFHSVQRDRLVDFSPPYTVIHHAVFVRRDAPAIETEGDLRGKEIIVMRGDIMHDYVLEKGLCDNPVLVDTQADALRLLASGEHDCALVAKLPGLYWAKELGLSNIMTVGPLLRPSDYSYAVTEGDAALLDRLAEGLAIIERAGRHKKIYDKWLGVLEPRGVSSGTVILYVAVAAAIPSLLLAILAIWSRTLRSQVARRTEDLRESEKKFRAIFEQAAVGAAQIETPTGQFVRVNQRYCDILGLTPDELTAATFMDITHPDDLQEDLDNMERLKTGEIREFSMEKRYFRRDGSTVWVNLTVSPMWKPGESQNYHVAVVEDITERKRAEEAMRESEERWRSLTSNTKDFIQILDTEGKILHMNRVYPPRELKDVIGKSVFEYMVDEFKEVAQKSMDRLLAGEGPQTFETAVHVSESSIAQFDVKFVPMLTGGKIDKIISVVTDITQKKRSERALRESEAKLQAIFNQTYQFIGLLSTEGRLLAANDTALAFGGLTESDVLGKFFWETPWWTHDAQQQAALRNAIDRAAEGELVRFEAYHPDGDGGIRFVDFSVKPVEDDTGTIAFLLPEGRDITEHKQAEETLRESEERLTSFMNSATESYHLVDRDMRIVEINDAAMAAVKEGRPDFGGKEDVFGKHMTEVYPFLIELGWDQNLDEVLESGKRWREEGLLSHPTRGDRWISVHAFQVHDGLGIIATDITERRRAQELLRESEERYRLFVDNFQGIAFYGRWDFSPIFIHGTVEEITGYTEEDFTAGEVRWDQLFHPDDLPDLQKFAEKIQKVPRHVIDYAHRIVRKDGQIRWVRELVQSVCDDTGRPAFVHGAVYDITERRRAQEEKLALERQVQHAQKLESLGVLAGGIAHDFNNLLMAILGNADLALSELSPMSPARGNLRAIEEASKRAAGLAKQMLAYSGKGRFVVEPIDAGELVEEMAHLLEVSISKKAVLKYNFAENLPTFDGDVTQIRQVIMNLITNASEAIGDRSGVIALSTGAVDCDLAYLDDVNEVLRAGLDEPLPEGVYTYLEVADTGCGMDAETIEKVFDPFFTTKFTGRGLGMSAVLGIVRGHKGAIKIYSEVGKGTTFKVFFPANERPDEGIYVRKKDEADGKDWRGSGTVLIADDEETVCAVGKQMLERIGFRVETASDGREAMKVFGEHADEIVCVLLDLTMPHLDGEEAFRKMRRLRPGVSVILCSGYNEQDATQRFAGKGLAGFIQKPFTMAALTEKLMDVLAAGEGEQ